MRQKSHWETVFEELARLDGDDDHDTIQIKKLKRFLRKKSSKEVKKKKSFSTCLPNDMLLLGIVHC